MKKIYKVIILVLVVAVIASVIGIVVARSEAPSTRGGQGGVSSEQTHPLTPRTLGAEQPPTNPIQVPILVYHMFGPQVSKTESPMQSHYRVTAAAFDAQMDYLAKNNYTPITFDAYVNYLNGGAALPAKSIVLTFDDGWETQYEYALPILQKYRFTGTFFIISSYPGYPAYMTWSQIIALDQDGMEIGSHTVHHINLTNVTAQVLLSEITDSKTTIESELGHPIETFAYPEYAQNSTVQEALQNAGYVGARAGWGDYKNSVSSVYEITSQEAVNNPDPFSRIRLPDSQTP